MYGTSLINVKLAADAAAAPSGVWEVCLFQNFRKETPFGPDNISEETFLS